MFNPIQQGPEAAKMYTDAVEAELERKAEEHRALQPPASRLRRLIRRLRRNADRAGEP